MPNLPAAILATLFLAPSIQAATTEPLIQKLEKDLKTRKTVHFEQLIENWERNHGPQAATPLLKLAQDRSRQDADRYIALMAAAKLGGPALAPTITSLLKDRSWMIRNAALRTLATLKNPSTAKDVLPLLSDPALVVRMEAVRAVEILQPIGSAEALVDCLKNPANYNGGKSLWVPSRALDAIAKLQARHIITDLKPLLDHGKDAALQKKTLETLELLTGKSPMKGKSLTLRIKAWKTLL